MNQADSILYRKIQSAPDYRLDDLSALFKLAKSPQGLTSYEILAGEASRIEGRIVDLASGDGAMAEVCLQRKQSGCEIVLVDFDPAAIQFAREKIRDRSVVFRTEPAQQLSIESDRIDYVFCHLGLMFFDPLEPALQEIFRVLRPGGCFIFNILAPLEDEFSRGYFETCEKYEKNIPDFSGWGDSRAASAEGLISLCAKTELISVPHFEQYKVYLKSGMADIRRKLKSFYQIGFLLPKQFREHLELELDELARRYATREGELTAEFAFLKGVMRKSA